MFYKALIISISMILHQAAFGITVTINGRTVNLDDIQNVNVNPNSISEDEFNQLTPTQQQQIIDEYNRRNGTSLNSSQFLTEIRNQANNNNNTVNDHINNNPTVRDVINDPANADTDELRESANLTEAQIREIEAAQAELRAQQEATAAAAARLAQQQAQLQQTQNNLNSLNDNANDLNNSAANLESQIANTGGQIAELERQAAEAQARGDLEAAQAHQDSIDRLRVQEQQARQRLAQTNADKQRIQNDIAAAEGQLREQQRQQQIEQAALEASKAQEDALAQRIVQNVVDGVVDQDVGNLTGSGSGTGTTVGDVIDIIQDNEEKGNITVDEDGNVQVDTDAVADELAKDNPQGFCTESGICLSNERAAEALACNLGPADQKDACMQEVSRGATIDYIQGGEVCAANQSEGAKACRGAGRTYNCEFKQCLTEAQVNALADAGAACMNKESTEQRDACFGDVKETAIRNGASGLYCLNTSDEAKACEAGGKTWNCNVDYCTDDYQNKAIADAVVECQLKDNPRDREICMNELEANGAYLLASACAEAESEKGLQCKEGGNVWNCEANACVTSDMNGRLVEAYKNCQNKPTQAEKDTCMGELQEIADAANSGEEITAEDLENPGSPATMAYIASTGLGAVAGYMLSKAAGGNGLCYAMAANVLAAGMAVMNEKNSKKSGDAQISQLKKEFEAFEKRLAEQEDVISFEMQRESIEFYIRSLTTGINVAEMYAKGYDQAGNMFAIAAVIAGVEAAIYAAMTPPQWPKVRCAVAQLASAGLSMGVSKYAAGAARKIANELSGQKDKLERIRELYMKHFGNYGGLSTLAYGGRNGSGINTQVGGSGTITSATGSSIKNDGLDGLSASSAGCMSASGSFESDCACRSTNSCLNLQSPPILNDTKVGRSVATKLNTDQAFAEANAIASGKLSHTDLNGDQLASRFKDSRKVHKKMFDQLEKKYGNKLKKENISLQFPDNHQLAKFLNKHVPREQRQGAESKFLGNLLGSVDLDDIKETQTALSKNFTEDGRAVATQTQPIQSKVGKFAIPKIPEFGSGLSEKDLDTLAVKRNQEILNSELINDAEKLKEVDDVHENSTTSLWNILTHRYHVLTRQKRIGKFRRR